MIEYGVNDWNGKRIAGRGKNGDEIAEHGKG